MQSFTSLYNEYDAFCNEEDSLVCPKSGRRDANLLQSFLSKKSKNASLDGFSRIKVSTRASRVSRFRADAFAWQKCRTALDALDRQGWQRSYHQRLFHDNFIRACVRVFFKTDPPGSFARAHQSILDMNGWDNLSQEILISTPRRFG